MYASPRMRGPDRETARAYQPDQADHENPLPDRKQEMATKTPYERRMTRVRDVVREYSDLDDSAATALAVQVLRALDSIPEKIR
ncbi:hypothetical protein AWN90_02750 [Nocardia terpenica]|uniref:Uncharacterized protein n=1 Tax=Nocardia terpenica TaxID=455432 RepID=A0A164KRP4_9NOCA|nr:hypothetical protein AWN90_02750 [Nocardia terpenica]